MQKRWKRTTKEGKLAKNEPKSPKLISTAQNRIGDAPKGQSVADISRSWAFEEGQDSANKMKTANRRIESATYYSSPKCKCKTRKHRMKDKMMSRRVWTATRLRSPTWAIIEAKRRIDQEWWVADHFGDLDLLRRKGLRPQKRKSINSSKNHFLKRAG